MARTPNQKELCRTRLANTYGGWIYCEGCNKTIGYLCYVTYDRFRLRYTCVCGNTGSIAIAFDTQQPVKASEDALIVQKNRLCCPVETAPLFSLRTANLRSYKYAVLCSACHTLYRGEKTE